MPEAGEDAVATISVTETLSEEEQEELRSELAKVRECALRSLLSALRIKPAWWHLAVSSQGENAAGAHLSQSRKSRQDRESLSFCTSEGVFG